MKEMIRKLALALLTDDYGVNEASYEILRELLLSVEANDIIAVVHATDGRFYLPEGW